MNIEKDMRKSLLCIDPNKDYIIDSNTTLVFSQIIFIQNVLEIYRVVTSKVIHIHTLREFKHSEPRFIGSLGLGKLSNS